MKRNIGKKDQILRMVIGISLIAWGIATDSLWGAIGVVPLLTGMIRFCPAYPPLKISTEGK